MTELFLANSLTGKLEKFEHDKNIPIKWYTCGPTIYDSAHLGHARTFISFDVIRRVMMYLGYNIIYAMNITDIDDKIINKVKQLSPNNEVNDEIYYKFIKEMESDFWADMDSINVLRPTIVTRVTEYIDKIKEYTEKIENNNLAYVSNGTVYVDSQKYIEKGFNWDVFGRATTTEYTECDFSGEKKNNNDFALWKAAKPGELKFDSKWGQGRPGWHLECSVMSRDILGDTFDIHSGGIDLIYPHHNNEIVQSIAYNDLNKIPIKLFLHSGHLNINGEKMAKSLGNFITIKKYLQTYSPRQLRLLFLLHSWNKPMDFTQNVIDEVNITEKRLIEFYANMEHLRRSNDKNSYTLTQSDMEYLNGFIELKNNIQKLLLQNIDTRNVIKLILDYIQTSYKYTSVKFNINLVNNFVDYMNEIFNVFGLEFNKTFRIDKSDIYIDMIVEFRKNIRDIIKPNIKDIPKDISKKIFNELDQIRDSKLKSHNIIIEDIGNDIKWKRINL
ncbi:cysteinyl-tRNA synthetase [Fadolivirus algeromassiliense]|jgi:cysteinyl-tRNA synthetase|uniref:cysteine--tRNA ligase n=1 Tax=Fadolivirus FV1/VV64 TaxID=3070911 RepID=A0A7D3QVC0_9VIRU|nr:cysteinyl-tRNA synthetase [Fadolivirus algeromassiliense]QKF94144.1 cysteinyl-tRNA synthetase [Fadolivirus FV1/VV64]